MLFSVWCFLSTIDDVVVIRAIRICHLVARICHLAVRICHLAVSTVVVLALVVALTFTSVEWAGTVVARIVVATRLSVAWCTLSWCCEVEPQLTENAQGWLAVDCDLGE